MDLLNHPIQSIEVDECGFEVVVVGKYIHGDDSETVTVKEEEGNSRIFFEGDVTPLIWGDTASLQIRSDDDEDLITSLRFERL